MRLLGKDGSNRYEMQDVVRRIKGFMGDEARFCFMDFGCVTVEDVYRMLGGQFSMDDIKNGLMELRKKGIQI